MDIGGESSGAVSGAMNMPGGQITLEPGAKHWFQAGDQGAVLYSFSSVARDVLDGFTDPDIQRVTQIQD